MMMFVKDLCQVASYLHFINKYSRTPPYRSHWDWRFFTFISGLPLKRGKITLNTIIWDLKILTFIDGEPLKARLLLRGPTVFDKCDAKSKTRVLCHGLHLDQERKANSLCWELKWEMNYSLENGKKTCFNWRNILDSIAYILCTTV